MEIPHKSIDIDRIEIVELNGGSVKLKLLNWMVGFWKVEIVDLET